MSFRIVGSKPMLVINAISLAVGLYGVYYSIIVVELPPHLVGAGPWQFLTNLSLVYSMIVFALGFVAHWTKSQDIYVIKNLMHPVGLALESIVAVIYWPLRLFFIHLLLSDPTTKRIPVSVDLAIHLMPVVSLLIDYLIFMPRWTISIPSALGVCTFLTVCYWSLLQRLIDVESGAKYPYGFLNVPTEKDRFVVFGIVGLVSFVQFLLLKRLYDLVVDYKKDHAKKQI